MSYVNPRLLRGVGDALLSTVTTTLPFTTAQLIRDALTQYGSYIRAFRIVNNDALANLTYRQGSPSEPLKTVPLSSEVVVEGWESYIEVNPNAATGSGFVELDLVNRFEALRDGRKDREL